MGSNRSGGCYRSMELPPDAALLEGNFIILYDNAFYYFSRHVYM